MKSSIREFQIFAKPVGSACNLNCSYCYYLSKKELYPGSNPHFMSDDVLEKYIKQHISATTDNIINFSWHGGEPLLAGIDFYKKVLQIQSVYKPAGKIIQNGIQTNATLLNEQWCSLFARENFIIGVSLDGPEELHNLNRITRDGHSSWQAVINGINLLLRYGIIPEILCVVNSRNVKHPLRVYEFFKQFGARFMTFLPLVEKEPGSATGVSPDSVRPDEFGIFLSEIFDSWVEHDIGEVKIQIFEEAARTAFDQPHTLCIFKQNCGGVPVVEHNGDFYSCDHYVNPQNLLGNILQKPLSYFLDCERQKDFGLSKSSTIPEYCRKCEVLSMCNGECPKNRFILTPDGEYGLNYLCSGYKYFFNHCRPFVEAIAEALKGESS
jgi:uncharacterized protein